MPTTVTIPLPGNAEARLSYVPPQDPPGSGSSWEPQLDYPGVQVQIRLPRLRGTEVIDPALRSEKDVLLGETLWKDWGWATEAPDEACWMAREHTCRAPTLRQAEADARRLVAECAGILRGIADARSKRLAQRQAIIDLAHSEHETITHDDPAAPGS